MIFFILSFILIENTNFYGCIEPSDLVEILETLLKSLWYKKDVLKCCFLGITYGKIVMVVKGFDMVSNFTLYINYFSFFIICTIQTHNLFISIYSCSFRSSLFFFFPNLCTSGHVVI